MKLVFTLLAILTLNAYSVTFTFVGPCSPNPILEKDIPINGVSDVGSLTVKFLEAMELPYQGTERGINSIFNTPTGLEAMEVISDNEMLAYGWCYSINGHEPAKYPNEVQARDSDHILWWFGYARYLNGEWISQCAPSHTRRSSQFCEF